MSALQAAEEALRYIRIHTDEGSCIWDAVEEGLRVIRLYHLQAKVAAENGPFGPRSVAAVVVDMCATPLLDDKRTIIERRDSEIRNHVANSALIAARATVGRWYVENVGSEEDLQLEVIRQELGRAIADIGVLDP